MDRLKRICVEYVWLVLERGIVGQVWTVPGTVRGKQEKRFQHLLMVVLRINVLHFTHKICIFTINEGNTSFDCIALL
jgi:hypothetical protein